MTSAASSRRLFLGRGAQALGCLAWLGSPPHHARAADDPAEDKAAGPERNETFYRVMVRTDKNHLGMNEHPLPIIPGMVATVEILTGEKTVLDYLLKPARLLRDEALRER